MLDNEYIKELDIKYNELVNSIVEDNNLKNDSNFLSIIENNPLGYYAQSVYDNIPYTD